MARPCHDDPICKEYKRYNMEDSVRMYEGPLEALKLHLHQQSTNEPYRIRKTLEKCKDHIFLIRKIQMPFHFRIANDLAILVNTFFKVHHMQSVTYQIIECLGTDMYVSVCSAFVRPTPEYYAHLGHSIKHTTLQN